MSRRIEVELTSSRDDGTWTWRAAGAKQPKGVLSNAVLYEGAAVGDVVRAEADFLLDGIEILEVLPPKGARKEPEFLEIIGSGKHEGGVTSQLVENRRGARDRDGEGRGGRGDRKGGDRNRGDRNERPQRDRKPRDGGDRGRSDRPRSGQSHSDRQRPDRPQPDARPKAARLRPGRTHRNAVLAGLAPELRPIADQVLRGGVPSVRQEVEKQNVAAKAAGQPEIKADVLLAVAENLNPLLKAAEWRDRAEAAIAGIDEIDLRDIRSVVVAADSAGRDEAALALAEDLRSALTARVDNEQQKWLAELAQTMADGRTVRALRLSSRPPKAGFPLPPDMALRLAAAASESLTAEASQDRWATVLDAIAFSPVRSQVTPIGLPAQPNDALLGVVKKLATRIPELAKLFGVEADAPRKRKPRGGAKKLPAPPPMPPPPATAVSAQPAVVADEGETAQSDQAAEPKATEPAEANVVDAEPTASETAVEAQTATPAGDDGSDDAEDGAVEPATTPTDG